MNAPNQILQKTLMALHRDASEVHRLWHDKARLLPLLECALAIQAGQPGRTALGQSAAYLLNYVLVFFAGTAEGLGALLRSLPRADLRATLANQWLSNELIALAEVSALARSQDVWTLEHLSAEDTEWLARISAQYLLRHALPNSLSVQVLVPEELRLGPHAREYLLGWAYEEGKLDPTATQYFAQAHPAKFAMLQTLAAAHPPAATRPL